MSDFIKVTATLEDADRMRQPSNQELTLNKNKIFIVKDGKVFFEKGDFVVLGGKTYTNIRLKDGESLS